MSPTDDGDSYAKDEAAAVDLTEVEVQILAIAGKRWKFAGAKESAIRDQLGISATRFHQVLDALIDRPAALQADPVLINRLRRLRQLRSDHRANGSQR